MAASRHAIRAADGVYRQATGEPVKTDFFWDWIDVGSEGPFAKQIPIKANTVRDLVDHYDELVELFATWPNEENPGEIHDSAGTLLHYYVTGDSP